MTRHLVSKRTGDTVDLLFDATDEALFSYTVSRTAIGVVFPTYESTSRRDYGYACVIGERVFEAVGRNRHSERVFPVLDESDATNTNDLMDELIRLKDKYLCESVFVQNEPIELVTTLRKMEGLTHYEGNRIAEECRAMWPTFQGFDTVAKLRPVEVPGREQVHRDLDYLLSTWARDPDTFQPMLDSEGKTTPKLFVMRELNTHKASTGIQMGMDEPEICGAIWLAAVGLNRSRNRLLQQKEVGHVWSGSKGTGY